jgi:hypothetical protein
MMMLRCARWIILLFEWLVWFYAVAVISAQSKNRDWSAIPYLMGAIGLALILHLIQRSILRTRTRSTRVVVLVGTGKTGGAQRILGLIERFLPKRVARDEVGDCLERIAQQWEDRPHWQVYGLIVGSVGWLLVNGAREWMSALGRKALNR